MGRLECLAKMRSVDKTRFAGDFLDRQLSLPQQFTRFGEPGLMEKPARGDAVVNAEEGAEMSRGKRVIRSKLGDGERIAQVFAKIMGSRFNAPALARIEQRTFFEKRHRLRLLGAPFQQKQQHLEREADLELTKGGRIVVFTSDDMKKMTHFLKGTAELEHFPAPERCRSLKREPEPGKTGGCAFAEDLPMFPPGREEDRLPFFQGDRKGGFGVKLPFALSGEEKPEFVKRVGMPAKRRFRRLDAPRERRQFQRNRLFPNLYDFAH